MKAIRTILVPTDFSKNSGIAWKQALDHGERYKTKLVIIHVLLLVPRDYQFLIGTRTPARVYEKLRKTAERRLMRMSKEAEQRGIKCEVIVRQGSPFVGIIRAAREKRAQLIIMGSHGRTGIAHILLGSVAEKVVRKAPCSVLVARSSGKRFRMP